MTKEQINRKIGENIRNARLNMEMTQWELSEHLSLSPNLLGLIERGKKDITVHTLLEISGILNISVNSLVNIDFNLLLLDNIENSLKIKKNFVLILLASLTEPDLNFLITTIKYIRNIRIV